MPAMTTDRTWNITEIARAAGVNRYVVMVILNTHDIPREVLGNHTIVGADGLRKLIPILSRYPGCDPSFADNL